MRRTTGSSSSGERAAHGRRVPSLRGLQLRPPGFEARHNRVYWELLPYLGLGNSAHSFRAPSEALEPEGLERIPEGEPRWGFAMGIGGRAHGRGCSAGEDLVGAQNRSRNPDIADLEPEARGLVEGWVSKGQAIGQVEWSA